MNNRGSRKSRWTHSLRRWFHWTYAHAFAYYWLPCPLCGEYYGGHESHYGGYIDVPAPGGGSYTVCDTCARTLLAQDRTALRQRVGELETIINCLLSGDRHTAAIEVLYKSLTIEQREICIRLAEAAAAAGGDDG